jgi:hypothetical protein
MKQNFPKATRELEYVAVFDFEMSTLEGPAHIFIAVDAFRDFAFNLGVDRDKNPETVLKNIYFLMENPEFVKHIDNGFTLVLGEYEELSERIQAILNPVNGKLLFNKSFNNFLALPFLKHFSEQSGKLRKK